MIWVIIIIYLILFVVNEIFCVFQKLDKRLFFSYTKLEYTSEKGYEL